MVLEGSPVQTTMSRLGLSPGLSFFKRINTIGFDVESVGGTRRITTADFIKFVKDDVGVRPPDIRSIQRHPIAPYCFLGLHDEDTMNRIWTRISTGVQWTNKGEVYPFLCTESYTEVKVKGMIPGTDPLEVSTLMDEFGEVLSCKEFKTKIEGSGRSSLCDTGDFLLRMKLVEPIPRLLPSGSDGDVWVVYYEGQEDACWRCLEPGHMTRECRGQGTSGFTQEQRAGKLAFRALQESIEDDREAGESGEELAAPQPGASVGDSLPLHFTSTPVNNGGTASGEEVPAEGNASLDAAAPVAPVILVNSQAVEDLSQDMIGPSQDTGVANEKSGVFTPGNTQELLDAAHGVEERERVDSSSSTLDLETGGEKVTFSKGPGAIPKDKKRSGSSSNLPNTPKRTTKNVLNKLVATPLGQLADQGRRNSGDMNTVKIPAMTPEERRRLVAQKQK